MKKQSIGSNILTIFLSILSLSSRVSPVFIVPPACFLNRISASGSGL